MYRKYNVLTGYTGNLRFLYLQDVKPTLSIKLGQLSLWESKSVMNCNYI